MAKKKTIFDMELDEFKANVDRKTVASTPEGKNELLLWAAIGMLRKIGIKLGLGSGEE